MSGGRRGRQAGLGAILASGLLLALGGCAAQVGGPERFLATSGGPINDFAVPMQSMEARKFATVVRQRYDFSCGSGALATLLHFHYEQPVGETQVFQGMWRDGDRKQIQRVGFSMLDMKRYLASRGLRSDGYKVGLDKIATAGLPGIVLITVRGYRHFVVLKGVGRDEVLVGDPALGLRTMPRAAFLSAWNGVYFVINDRLAVARSHFNGTSQWASLSRAPAGEPFTGPLSQQALLLTAPFYRDF